MFVTFTVHVLLGNTITASRVFKAMSLYTAVRLTVTLFFPAAIETLSEAMVSVQRIQVNGRLLRLYAQLGIFKSGYFSVQMDAQDSQGRHVGQICCMVSRVLKTKDWPSRQNAVHTYSLKLEFLKMKCSLGPVFSKIIISGDKKTALVSGQKAKIYKIVKKKTHVELATKSLVAVTTTMLMSKNIECCVWVYKVRCLKTVET